MASRAAGPEDIVVIYFSGHGSPDLDPSHIADDGIQKYFVCHDPIPRIYTRRHFP